MKQRTYLDDQKNWQTEVWNDPQSSYSRPATKDEINAAKNAPPEDVAPKDTEEVDGKTFKLHRVDATTVIGTAPGEEPSPKAAKAAREELQRSQAEDEAIQPKKAKGSK